MPIPWTIAGLADEVGYESEAAFSRAFKREFGQPSGRYRADRGTLPVGTAAVPVEAAATALL